MLTFGHSPHNGGELYVLIRKRVFGNYATLTRGTRGALDTP